MGTCRLFSTNILEYGFFASLLKYMQDVNSMVIEEILLKIESQTISEPAWTRTRTELWDMTSLVQFICIFGDPDVVVRHFGLEKNLVRDTELSVKIRDHPLTGNIYNDLDWSSVITHQNGP